MTGFMEKGDYNFSHRSALSQAVLHLLRFLPHTPCRIERLSFGEDHAGIIQPLEGDEKLTDISRKADSPAWLMVTPQI